MTINSLFLVVKSQHWSQSRYQKSGWAKEVEKYFRLHIESTFGAREAKSISISEVRSWHLSLIDTPTTANRSLEVLSKLFNYAQDFELLPLGMNPCRRVKAFPERQRQRFASEKEIVLLGAMLLQKPRTLKASFILLLALTGIRPRKLGELLLSDIVYTDGGAFITYDGKTTVDSGIQESLALSEFALQIIRELPPRHDGLLIGPVEYRHYWDSLRRAAGCPDLWARDLRRTFATIGLSNGVGLDAIGELLNHRSIQTTRRYAKLLPTARISAATMIGKRVHELLQGRGVS